MRISDIGVVRMNKILNRHFKNPIKGIAFYDGETLNQSSHLINLLQYWFGKVKKVYNLPSDKKIVKKYGINFSIEFKNAKIFFIGLNIPKFSYASLELMSSDGRIYYGERGSNITFQKSIKDKVFYEDKLPSSNLEYIKNDINNYQKNVLNQIQLFFLKKKSYLCEANLALETLKIINKLLKK